MAGFEPKEMKKNKIEIDLEDDDFEIDTDIDEEEPQPSSQPSQRKKSSNKPATKKNSNIVRDTNKNNKKEENTKIIVAVGVVTFIIIISIIFIAGKMSKAKEEPVEETPVVTTLPEEQKTKPGVPNLNGTGADQNDDRLYDPSLITKDLNGNSLNPDYKIINNEEITDFISYTKFRAPMGNGVEFYWLEAEYKGEPYKVQVPYSVYSKLDREGITVVDIELLTLEDGSKMITYMEVRKDAKSLLDKNR